MTLFYISFAADEFLGATVVEAESPEDAIHTASRKGLNPGGQAAIIAIDKEFETLPDIAVMRDRLMSRSDMMELGAVREGDLSESERQAFFGETEFVCECCNEIHPKGHTH